MGRSAYIERLALGRSPYGPPELTEDGEFILGERANQYSNHGYIQQFNSHGHPQNEATEAAIRRFTRAQNEVMEVAGVVKSRRAAISAQKKAVKRQKVLKAKQEDNTGALFTWPDRILETLCTHSVWAFRARFQVERPLSPLPELELTAFADVPVPFAASYLNNCETRG